MTYRNLMNRYHPSTLEKRKGKWYVSVTKPRELQFGKDRQKRKSTGTSDKRQAEYLQHELTQAIHDEFEKELKKTDRFFEAVRPMLEAEGVRARDWYDKGYVDVTLSGEKAITSRFRREGDPEPFSAEVFRVRDHGGVCAMLNFLGHPIPADLLTLLDEDTRSKVLKSAKPLAPPPEMVMDMIERFGGDRGKVAGLIERMKDLQLTSIAEDTDATETGLQGVSDPKTVRCRPPKLEDVIDAYIAYRPEKSRKADRLQLNKWLNDPLSSIPLKDITQYDAYDFFNELGEIYTKSSIRVLRAALSNVFMWAGKRRDLGITGNPFRGLDLKNVGKDGTPRRPFTHEELHKLFELDMTDSQRDALTILITTGMRGGELLQITADKVKVRDGIKYMDLTTSVTKNIGSKRFVPLHSKTNGVSFPIELNQRTLNDLVGKVTDDPTLTLHSLRHTFKDLCRDAGVSKEIQDFITGHGQGDAAGKYGQGPSITTRYDSIMAVKHPWL